MLNRTHRTRSQRSCGNLRPASRRGRELLNIALPRSEGKKKATNMSNSRYEQNTRVRSDWTIALDGGTTNTRARLLHEGRIVATARRAVGVRDTVLTEPLQTEARTCQSHEESELSPRTSLEKAVNSAISEVALRIDRRDNLEPDPVRPDRIVAAGMLSSEVGLFAVPHVPAPAGMDELAAAVVIRSIPQISTEPIHFIPGVRSGVEDGEDGWMGADVMRGEECECFGALSQLTRRGDWTPGRAGVVFIWPGSHTKLVEMDTLGRIHRSFTTLAGEILQAVARHTLVAASLPAELPDAPDPEAVEAGLRAAGRFGLARAAFLVRLAAFSRDWRPEQRASFWIGALVGEDSTHLAAHPILSANCSVWVGGREPLRSLYSRCLGRHHRGGVNALDDELSNSAAALGALEVAARCAQGSG